jgi:hypothetical protein
MEVSFRIIQATTRIGWSPLEGADSHVLRTQKIALLFKMRAFLEP